MIWDGTQASRSNESDHRLRLRWIRSDDLGTEHCLTINILGVLSVETAAVQYLTT